MLSQNLSGTLLREPCPVREEDLAAIHSLPNPPLVPLKRDDVYIRRCRLTSDQMDVRFGRFRHEDLPRLLELVQGAPVLIGHDRQTLGVARFFGGNVELRGEVTWIVPSFYWPRSHSQAEDLRVMIDSGVYNEASIAFLFQKPTCSICGEDLRSCPHWPGREYDGQLCFFWYDGVERVTEGSLVYRGASPGTGIETTCPVEDALADSAASELKPHKILKVKLHGKRYLATLYTEKPSVKTRS